MKPIYRISEGSEGRDSQGNKMAFPGLKNDADIANVIAYLKADPKP